MHPHNVFSGSSHFTSTYIAPSGGYWHTVMLRLFVVVGLLISLAACTSNESMWKKSIGEAIDITDQKLEQLGRDIDNGSIRNALVLEQYASMIKKQKPEMASLVDVLEKDATSNGPMYLSLQSRLSTVKKMAKAAPEKGEQAVADILKELDAISNASSPVLYGLMLSDPVNVLADLSDGKLPRVESMSKQAEKTANGARDYGSASKLVGNPQYGHWRQTSSGTSVWEWFAAYAIFNSLFHQPIYYNSWANHRPYSYYHDYGRSYYTSPQDYRSQRQVQQRTESKFKQQGKSFKSPYARKRTGSSTAASVTKRAAQPNRFSSSFAKQSGGSKSSGFGSKSNNSSQRSSSYKTSRSFSGGK